MTESQKYWTFNILDFVITYGGCAAVIVYNYITPTNSLGFKLTFTGIILVVALILFSKAVFERSYRKKYDMYLQQLAEATDEETKQAIANALEKHKMANLIYQRLMVVLPFVVLFIVTWLGEVALANLRGTTGLILASIMIGSTFYVIKQPYYEAMKLARTTGKKE
jgi:small-conductance mechanosensitive channel